MFKKLVSNLPFNPSLIHQIGFYADRLKKEKSIRRLSFVFMALAVAIQSLAVISPPERSLALSSNDIISGIKTKQDVINAWNNDPSVSKIYGKFGVTLKDIQNMSGTAYATVSTRPGTDYWSIGRNSLTSYTKVADVYKNMQISLKYDTNSYVYMRPLKSWDIRNPYNTYRAFKGTISATGETFWILEDCGNFAKVGKYTPPPPPPAPTPKPTPKPQPVTPPTAPTPKLYIKKSIISPSTTLKPGDSYTYALEYNNTATDSLAESVYIEDQLDTKNFTVVSPKNLNISSSGLLKHQVGNLAHSTTNKVLYIVVKLKNPLSTPLKVCNQATIKASNAGTVNSEKVCINVVNPCPIEGVPGDINSSECTEPEVVCSVVDSSVNLTTRKVVFKTTVTTTNDKLVKISRYNYSFGDDTEASIQSADFTNSTTHTYAPGDYEAQVKVDYTVPQGTKTTPQSVDCSQPITFDEDQPLGQSKTVRNETLNLDGDDALDQKVKSGDTLQYTLSTLNSQNYDRVNIHIEDYIGDILDYAELDLVSLEASGGKFDPETNKVMWDNVLIPANSRVESIFKVKMLDPIPTTNSPTPVSTDFDCRISNVYGNEITLEVQCPVVKGIETIPNTGPGTSMIAVTLITSVVGYFFARARLLDKELGIIRTDYAVTGGM